MRRLDIGIDSPEGVIRVGASLGIAFFPEDGANAGDILRRADQAMYRAKARRRGEGAGVDDVRALG